jgi:hypothetical protein
MFRKISAAVIAAEKPALIKTSVGAVGTWVSAHEIQVYVGVATLIFVILQIIAIIPKVRASMRQMAVEREREKRRKAVDFSDIKIEIPGEEGRRETWKDKLKRCFRAK